MASGGNARRSRGNAKRSCCSAPCDSGRVALHIPPSAETTGFVAFQSEAPPPSRGGALLSGSRLALESVDQAKPIPYVVDKKRLQKRLFVLESFGTAKTPKSLTLFGVPQCGVDGLGATNAPRFHDLSDGGLELQPFLVDKALHLLPDQFFLNALK